MALIVAAVALTIGVGVNIHQQNEAGELQEKQVRAQQRTAQAQAYRERVRAVREARIARGALINASEGLGTAGSSGAFGASSSLSSQFGGNFGFVGFTQEQQALAATFGQRAQDRLLRGQIAQTVGSLPMQFSSSYTRTLHSNGT